MAKKKDEQKGYYSLRSLSSRWNIFEPFYGWNNNSILRKPSWALNSFGFTLIELLIVIAMIGIIMGSAIILLNPLAHIQKGNDAKRKADLEQVQNALELYYNDFGRFPTASGGRIVMGSGLVWGTSAFGNYMAKLPQDPKSPRTYYYYSNTSSGNQSYFLYASLERGAKDSQACNGTNSACPAPSETSPSPALPAMQTACGAVCNYGVSSSNRSVE